MKEEELQQQQQQERKIVLAVRWNVKLNIYCASLKNILRRSPFEQM